MVLRLRRSRHERVPGFVIPDEQTWTLLGAESAMAGLQLTANPAAARVVLAPDPIPDELAEGVAALRELLPDDVAIDYRALPVPVGTRVRDLRVGTEAPAAGMEHGHGEHDGHGDGDGGHHDMMAIVGDPSADGLIMESIQLSHGPLAAPLPGGLVVDVTLDGDVVAESAIRALLRVEPAGPEPRVPDALTPVAWTVVFAEAVARAGGGSTGSERAWLSLAAVELERAVSHLAWLRSLGRLLDLHPLIEACTRSLAALQASRAILPYDTPHDDWLEAAVGAPDLPDGRDALSDLVKLVTRSRGLRWRLRGRAVLTKAEASSRGLCGPVARASGRAVDGRTDDPRYARLGFDPALGTQGDALARAILRAEEALAAVDLARRALEADACPDAGGVPGGAAVTEGPRGPLSARWTDGRWLLVAAGAEPARRAAADAMVGLEWSAALAVLASFDLSPWSVGA